MSSNGETTFLKNESYGVRSTSSASSNAEELKRKRLEAWRKRQQEKKQQHPHKEDESQPQAARQPVQQFSASIITTTSASNDIDTGGSQSCSMNHQKNNRRGKIQLNVTSAASGKRNERGKLQALVSVKLAPSILTDEDEDSKTLQNKRPRLELLDMRAGDDSSDAVAGNDGQQQKFITKKNSRWDQHGPTQEKEFEGDVLDLFMSKHIYSENHPRFCSTVKNSVAVSNEDTLFEGNSLQNSNTKGSMSGMSNAASVNKAMLDYLSWKTQQQKIQDNLTSNFGESATSLHLASEIKNEKQRREELLARLKEQVQELSSSADEKNQQRLYNDEDGGVMEEAERALDVLTSGQFTDAREVLAELNKKKELKAIDHSSINYAPIHKNLFICPKVLSELSDEDVLQRRANLKIKVRGLQVPAPITDFKQAGLSDVILQVLETKLKIRSDHPFPIQAQCLPVILSGRDCIGIAKTGSGKTLAYLLPMLRHIMAQPDLAPHESGPVGLILVPARELATQIHSVCKVFARYLGLKTTAVYGGAGVAEQIADLKRGCHIVVATPGRMIDILTMQAGKLLSLTRTSFLVLDESDRLYDMGFGPQIQAIAAAIRPDRQLVCFSATFPKSVENLARKSLKYPVEVIIGGKSVASDNVTQYGEVVQEQDKFLRLLQLLGEQVDDGKKAIVFVDTQSRADSVFEQLTRCGYLCLSLHGGKEQEDRDSTISDFKRSGGQSVLVATSVAGRGLDVKSCACVINYSPPNHVEDYVHRVGRTGRANMKGVAYTFVNPVEEAKFAPVVVRAMIESGQDANIAPELRALSNSFKEKVKKGEAKGAGSGYKGKGYSYDSTELTDAQRMIRIEKREALIEAGLLDPDENDPLLENIADEDGDAAINGVEVKLTSTISAEANPSTADSPIQLSAELLALPGMQEALMRKAGILSLESEDGASSGAMKSQGSGHFVEEFEINDYPREARWKITQKETTSRIQDEFQTAVTLKGEFFGENRIPAEGERKLYLHLEAQSEQLLRNCLHEIRRLLNEETLRAGARGPVGTHRYNVLG